MLVNAVRVALSSHSAAAATVSGGRPPDPLRNRPELAIGAAVTALGSLRLD
jgi:hypothetical protein